MLFCVVDVRDALVGVGLILNENGNFSFDKGPLTFFIVKTHG